MLWLPFLGFFLFFFNQNRVLLMQHSCISKPPSIMPEPLECWGMQQYVTMSPSHLHVLTVILIHWVSQVLC